jgi:hypothetical protein
MIVHRLAKLALVTGLGVTLSACGGGIGSGNLFNRGATIPTDEQLARKERADAQRAALAADDEDQGSTIWDLFSNADDPNTTVEVNKYIWQASLEVLNFLPIESVDPFTGVIVTGYGPQPEGGFAGPGRRVGRAGNRAGGGRRHPDARAPATCPRQQALAPRSDPNKSQAGRGGPFPA